MCGLVGVAGRLYPSDVDRFNWLLTANQLRGPYATGIGSNVGGRVNYLKIDSTPDVVLANKNIGRYVSPDATFLMGHNRWPTRGGAGPEHAHPFQHGALIGAHNGTVSDFDLGASGIKTKDGTDSERIIHHMSTNGVEQTLETLKGDWAFSIFDDATDTFYLTTNGKRPLSYAVTADGSRMYWASEAKMLEWILSREDRQVNKLHLDEWGIQPLGERELITIHIPRQIIFGKVQPLEVISSKIKERAYYTPQKPAKGLQFASSPPPPPPPLKVIDQPPAPPTAVERLIEEQDSEMKKLAKKSGLVLLTPDAIRQKTEAELESLSTDLSKDQWEAARRIHALKEEVSGIQWNNYYIWTDKERNGFIGKISAIHQAEALFRTITIRIKLLEAERTRRAESQKQSKPLPILPLNFGSLRTEVDKIGWAALFRKHVCCDVCGTTNESRFNKDSVIKPNDTGIVCGICINNKTVREQLLNEAS